MTSFKRGANRVSSLSITNAVIHRAIISRAKIRSSHESKDASQRDADLVSLAAFEEKWIEGDGSGDGLQGMETLEGPRGWDGVSFRGIDVPQYNPDAVDTPICNDPDAISAVARNCVLKMR